MHARHRWGRPLALATALALLSPLAAACSDDGSEGADAPRRTTTTADRSSTTAAGPTTTTVEPVPAEEPEAYVQALAATYGEDVANSLDLPQAVCIAESWVATIGPEAFASSGVRSAELAAGTKTLRDVALTEEQAPAMAEGMETCGLELRRIVYAGLGEAATDPAVQACLDENVSDELIGRVLIAQATAIAAPDDAFASAVVCLPG